MLLFNRSKLLQQGAIMRISFLIIASFLSVNLLAQPSYVCSSGDRVRLIEVIYSQPGQLVPCTVKYSKGDVTQILWSAQSQVGYCEAKAKSFADKQQQYGWQCIEMLDELDDRANSLSDSSAHQQSQSNQGNNQDKQPLPVKKSPLNKLEYMPEEELNDPLFIELEVES